MIIYDKPKMTAAQKRKAEREVASVVGSVSETGDMVKNDAALKIENMLGKKCADMFGSELEKLKREPQQYSMVFKDKGLRLKAMTAIAEKGRVTDFPTTQDAVFEEFELYMNYCDTFLISPTIGMFAAWLGTHVEGFEKQRLHMKTAYPEVASALAICKETIRGFLETNALDGNIAPAVYLHQNKAYFNAVETVTVKHETVQDAHVRDENQIADIIDMLPVEVKQSLNK